MSWMRREFLRRWGAGVTAASLSGLLGCSNNQQTATSLQDDAALMTSVADLEERIPQLMTELRVPGASISIISNGRIAWRKSVGIRDHASGAPVDDDTIFEAQSMSKPVFAYRVLKLAELGILDLDAPLTKYAPELFLRGDSRLELVTARRVLSHTTGFPNWRSKEDPLRINFTPGEKWSYSGEGYHYLQSVVTHLVGHTDAKNCGRFELQYRLCASDFSDYMAANLLRPFGMMSSGYVWTEAIGKRMATAHDKNGRPAPRPKSTPLDVARYGSAGSLLTTATDYARFLLEIVDPKPPDAFRLNEASRREMLRPHVDVPGMPFKMSWALGWQIWHLPERDVVAHGGDIHGFHSQAAFSPARRRGFVILTNGENGSELISKHLLKDLVDQFA